MLSPALLRSLYALDNVPQQVVEVLGHADYMASALAAEEWIGAFQAMLAKPRGWTVIDELVWHRVEELSEDVGIAKVRADWSR